MRQFIGGTLYTKKLGFKKFFPCSNETSADNRHTLRGFIELVSLPLIMKYNNYKIFKKVTYKWLLQIFWNHPNIYESSLAVAEQIQICDRTNQATLRKLLIDLNTPIWFWCFCYEYTADIISLCVTGCFELQGRTPYEIVMNYTPDICEYASFLWFQWLWLYYEILKNK